MKKSRLLGAALACTLSSLSHAASEDNSSFLCVAEQSTGFAFKNGEWGPVNFNVDGEKYIIRATKIIPDLGHEQRPYGLYNLGDDNVVMNCDGWSVGGAKKIHCSTTSGYFLFSEYTGRFIKTYREGYVYGEKIIKATPSITIGRCSRI